MSSSETPIVSPPDILLASRLRSNDNYVKKQRERLHDSPYDVIDDTRPKTRRVNPERLATRLDPRLVAEMDALIVPGAKMPSFSIRKDFQERYCVDRRHIYDYFHSRGLRVAKEDKHNNLLRGRLLKARSQTSVTTDYDDSLSAAKQPARDRAKAVSGKAKRTRVQSIVDLEKQDCHSINGASESLTISVGSLPLSSSPSLGPEESTSLNASPVPGASVINEVSDVTICSYTELGTTNSSMDNPYNFYGEYQTYDVSLSMPPTVFGLQDLSSSAEEFAPFVQEDHLGYYDLAVFAQNGSFQDSFGRSCDKTANHYVNAKGESISPALETPRFLETKSKGLKVQIPESAKQVARGEGEVDFSKWLLAIELYDDKNGRIGIPTEESSNAYTTDPSTSYVTDPNLHARDLAPNFPQGY